MHARVFKSWHVCQEKRGSVSAPSYPYVYISEDKVLRAIPYQRKSLQAESQVMLEMLYQSFRCSAVKTMRPLS